MNLTITHDIDKVTITLNSKDARELVEQLKLPLFMGSLTGGLEFIVARLRDELQTLDGCGPLKTYKEEQDQCKTDPYPCGSTDAPTGQPLGTRFIR